MFFPPRTDIQHMVTPVTHPGYIGLDMIKEQSSTKSQSTLPNFTGYGNNIGNSK